MRDVSAVAGFQGRVRHWALVTVALVAAGCSRVSVERSVEADVSVITAGGDSRSEASSTLGEFSETAQASFSTTATGGATAALACSEQISDVRTPGGDVMLSAEAVGSLSSSVEALPDASQQSTGWSDWDLIIRFRIDRPTFHALHARVLGELAEFTNPLREFPASTPLARVILRREPDGLVLVSLYGGDGTPGIGAEPASAWSEGMLETGTYVLEAIGRTWDDVLSGVARQRSYAALALAVQIGGDSTAAVAAVRDRARRLDNHFQGRRCSGVTAFAAQ